MTSAAASVRRLDWPDCVNARDLGGLPVDDGWRTKRGALTRSDVLWRLTEAGRRAVVDHGVRTIVDVRFADELAQDDGRYPFRDGGTVHYLNVPFNTRRELSRAELDAVYGAAKTRAELIKLDLDVNRNGIGAAVAAMADAVPGGVLVHCHAGKDRTGVIVAVLLAALGVADDFIADDYEATAENFEALIEEWLDSQSQDPVERAHLRDISWPSRAAMLDALTHLRARYGSARDYLHAAGVTADQLGRLRERMLEPVAPVP